MKRPIRSALTRLFSEPPFRILARAALRMMKPSVSTRALWEISERPVYLLGVLAAAQQAIRQDVKEISVMEFGVAGGNGLLALEKEAAAVEGETGVRIQVYGFDAGAAGLPKLIGDYRDHPDAWKQGDYPMDEEQLRARLSERTKLIIGPVHDTTIAFWKTFDAPPVGFISIDVRVTHCRFCPTQNVGCYGMYRCTSTTSTSSLTADSAANCLR